MVTVRSKKFNMYLLSKEQRGNIFSVVNSSYYLERVKYLSEYLKNTRDPKHRNDPEVLLAIQLEAGKFETETWKIMAEQRDQIKLLTKKPSLSKEDEDDLQNLKEGWEIHKHLVRISRTIFDGVAWRSLGYNRLFLTSAARSATAGAFNIEQKSTKSLYGWAMGIQKSHKSLVLINDITRFLRIGDLTEVYKGRAVIHELKKNGDRIINFKTIRPGSAVTSQTRKMMELQTVAMTGRITLLDGQKLVQQYSNVNLQTHFKAVEKLIESSDQLIVTKKLIEPFIQLSVFNLSKAWSRPEKFRKYIKVLRYTGWKTGYQFSQTNYDQFFYDELGNFIRNIVPYSIFPLKDEYCMKLMSGEILIESTINYEILVYELRKRGWKAGIVMPDFSNDHDEKMKHLFDNKEFLYNDLGEKEGFIQIERGPFFMTIPHNWVSKMSSEFMTFDTFCGLLEDIYQQASIVQATMTIHPEFANADKVWN